MNSETSSSAPIAAVVDLTRPPLETLTYSVTETARVLGVSDSVVVTSGSEVTVSSVDAFSTSQLAKLRLLVEHFADADRNGVRIRQFFLGDPTISSQDPRCTTNPLFNDVVCNVLPTRIVVNASEADDVVAIGGSNVGCEVGSPVETVVNLRGGNDSLLFGHCGDINTPNRLSPRFTAFGGAGQDSLAGNVQDDFLSGDDGDDSIDGGTGAGDDELRGGGGDDIIEGQGGNDLLDGDQGNDQLRGGGGDDDLDGAPGADLIDGGPGRDSASIGGSSPLAVRLDGVAKDGEKRPGLPSEGDNYISIEVLTGGAAGDFFVGSNAAETINGALGDDQIEGGGGGRHAEGRGRRRPDRCAGRQPRHRLVRHGSG